jgi:hypothetical protein
MTQDEIIKLANEAELCQTIWIEEDCIELESVIQFAKLVAEKERERISQKIAQLPFGDTAQSLSIWVKNDT